MKSHKEGNVYIAYIFAFFKRFLIGNIMKVLWVNQKHAAVLQWMNSCVGQKVIHLSELVM